MQYWVLEDFMAGEIPCQKIEFQFNSFSYIMIFNLISETHDDETIREKSESFQTQYYRNSYEIKFDLKDTFESDTAEFFTHPPRKATLEQLHCLSQLLVQLLLFHYENSHAVAYFFVAADERLKHFYDRVIKRYAHHIGFCCHHNLGEDGLAYELRTPHFRH